MNEKAVALLVFFMTLMIISQIRFMLRLRRIRKAREKLPGILFMGDAIEGLLCCACTGLECLSAVEESKDRKEEEEKKEKYLRGKLTDEPTIIMKKTKTFNKNRKRKK